MPDGEEAQNGDPHESTEIWVMKSLSQARLPDRIERTMRFMGTLFEQDLMLMTSCRVVEG